ncbi:uncharacterized protein LOC134817236 isoform X2 [Bolinopsis microptera]|uniref:uncharacterized protein LOC134817236 isoform X2 n=1 Tax=Bolinopsis microptera TaxID=2820187 RepID=UPI00307ABB7E
MSIEIYIYFAFGILAMLINISFLTITLCVQKSGKSAKRKKGVFKMMYITLLSSNCAMLLAPVIRYWATQLEVYNELWCILISYLSWISCSVNVCSILLISIDRFLAVMNPFRYVQLMKAGKVIGLQIVFMAWSFIMPQVAGTKSDMRYEYINELNFCLPTDNKVLFHAWYLVSYIFPAAVAVSLNGFIMRYLVRRLSVFTEKMETRRQTMESSRSGNSNGGSTINGKPSQDSNGGYNFSKLTDNAWSHRRRFSLAWGEFALNLEDSTGSLKRRVSGQYRRISDLSSNGSLRNNQKHDRDSEGTALGSEQESVITGRNTKSPRCAQYTTAPLSLRSSLSKNGSNHDMEIRPAKSTKELTFEIDRLQTEEARRSPSCCISYSGGDEISSSPISTLFLNITPRSGASEASPRAPASKSEKCVRKQFDVILKTITGCVTEFVLFTLAWTVVYVVTGILKLNCPVNTVMIILVHTIVTSVLYSASYTSYYNKALRAKAKFGSRSR